MINCFAPQNANSESHPGSSFLQCSQRSEGPIGADGAAKSPGRDGEKRSVPVRALISPTPVHPITNLQTIPARLPHLPYFQLFKSPSPFTPSAPQGRIPIQSIIRRRPIYSNDKKSQHPSIYYLTAITARSFLLVDSTSLILVTESQYLLCPRSELILTPAPPMPLSAIKAAKTINTHQHKNQ